MIKRLCQGIWILLEKTLNISIFLATFSLIFVLAHLAIRDLDIWLHLKAGEIILQNKAIPIYDIFSFTLQGKPWINHSWLFQVITYLTFNIGQVEALILLQTFILILGFLFLFLIGYRLTNSFFKTAIFILLVIYATMLRFNIRPDIFSILFFTIYLYCLKFHSKKKAIYLLIPIQILWVNIHGYFFLGILLVFFFIFAEFLRRRLKFIPKDISEESAIDPIAYKNLQKLFYFVILVSFINPNGLRGMFYPLSIIKETILGENRLFFNFISELRPVFGTELFFFPYYAAIIILSFLLIIVNFKKFKIIDAILLIFFTFFSFIIRHIQFGSYVGFLIILSYLDPAISKITLEFPHKKKVFYALKYIIIILFLTWIGVKIRNTLLDNFYYNFENEETETYLLGVADSTYPKKAVDFILRNNIPGNMFNDFNSGAYLIGKTYPRRKVFIDGRTEVYGQDFVKAYDKIIKKADISEFKKLIDKYNLNAAFFNIAPGYPKELMNYLYLNPEWKLVFFSDSGIVFLKDTQLNRDIINKYEINFKKYSPPVVEIKKIGLLKNVYPYSYIRRGFLLLSFEEYDAAIREAQEALRIMPGSYEAYLIMGRAYLSKGFYREAEDYLRKVLLVNPNNLEGLVALGESLKELTEYDLAIQVLDLALNFNKNYAPAYYELSKVYSLMGNMPKALENLNQALLYAPESAQYHLEFGQLLFALAEYNKDKKLALKSQIALEKAYKLNYNGKQDLLDRVDSGLKEIKSFLSSK